jgi:hypothetical protein
MSLVPLARAGDVINELLVHDRAAVCVWLEAALRTLPASNPAAPTVTRNQLVDFHQLIVAAESSTDVSHALREFSRYNRFYVNKAVLWIRIETTVRIRIQNF